MRLRTPDPSKISNSNPPLACYLENGLFIIGNKRSGSTHLMRLLNLHPNIFISNESDVVWILFNFHKDREIKNYEHDSPGGLERSMPAAGQVLNKENSPKSNFVQFQKTIMEKGFLDQKPMKKDSLKFIGDQKPYQQADPEIVPFILEMFPQAKFLHLVRHPFEVISSSMKFLGGTGGYIWKGMSPEEIFEKWVFHEENVIRSEKEFNLDIHRVFYNDMVRETEKTLGGIFDFLKVPSEKSLFQKANNITTKNFKSLDQYQVPDNAKGLMKEYGFKTGFSFYEREIEPKISRLIARFNS